MADTLAERIMAAATRAVYADHDRAEVRAELVALVAEATAERVCRWYPKGFGLSGYQQGCGHELLPLSAATRKYCPDCGGRVELVADA